jgi:hypothetical protein
MASITERICKDGTPSFRVLIRKKGIYLCKTFKTYNEAAGWVIKNETK